jgi:hypothetical protein
LHVSHSRFRSKIQQAHREAGKRSTSDNQRNGDLGLEIKQRRERDRKYDPVGMFTILTFTMLFSLKGAKDANAVKRNAPGPTACAITCLR